MYNAKYLSPPIFFYFILKEKMRATFSFLFILLFPIFLFSVRALGSASSPSLKTEKSPSAPIPLFSSISDYPQGFASVIEKEGSMIYTIFAPLAPLDNSFVYRAWLKQAYGGEVFPLGDLASSIDGFFLDVSLRRDTQTFKKIIISKDPVAHPGESSKNIFLQGTL